VTLEEFRKTLRVTEEKSGKGDKLTEVWYIRDRNDPKGALGSQTTVLNKAAVEWEITRRHCGQLQYLYNRGDLLFEHAQSLTALGIRKR
jgi:hypothetical protein